MTKSLCKTCYREVITDTCYDYTLFVYICVEMFIQILFYTLSQ